MVPRPFPSANYGAKSTTFPAQIQFSIVAYFLFSLQAAAAVAVAVAAAAAGAAVNG